MKFNIDKHFTKSDLKRVQAFVLPVWLNKGNAKILGEAFSLFGKTDQKLVKALLKEKKPKDGETRLVRLTSIPSHVYLAAFEDANELKFAHMVRAFVRAAKAEGFKRIGVYLDDVERANISAERMAAIVAEHALTAHFDFSEEFKTPPKDGWKRVGTVTLFTYHESKALREELSRGVAIGEAVNKCRTLSDYPPGDMTPEGLAEAARELGTGVKNLTVTVFDEKRLKSEGMNAILAVGKGSANPPRLIVMDYRGGKANEAPIAFVGKGVTFDSGGLNIKTGEGMQDMHLDMSGGAAVINAIGLIAKLGLSVNVLGLVPAAENMPSGLSYRQGDIIRAYGGKTIEIGNTDAEGRVILADAIEYAKTKKPKLIVTIATLTGSALSALGTRMSALFVKNNKPLQDMLQSIGDATGDMVWPLPLTDAYEKDVEGTFADVTNTHKSHSRYGGAITAAAFLHQFAKPTPFAHIDMAPRMTANPEEDALAKGAAGFGMRFFLELASRAESVAGLLPPPEKM